MLQSTQPLHHSLFSEFKISDLVEICIVIPVKNEEKHLLKTLHSLRNQVDVEGKSFDKNQFEILILANNCTDHSVSIIRQFQRENPSLSIGLKEITFAPQYANIGYVRRLLINIAFQRLQKNGGGIIITTDGDTQVSPDWISQNVLEFENGADAVGGRILLSEDDLEFLDENTLQLYYKDEEYQLLAAKLEAEIMMTKRRDNPNHHQHFNGSFAVKTDCYALSGGIPDVPHLEDCAFFESLQRIDAKVYHSSKVIVHTSARCIGRTDVGLSSQLHEWKIGGLPSSELMVTSADTILYRFNLKKNLQKMWLEKTLTFSDFEEAILKIETTIKITETDYQNYQSSQYFGTWLLDFMEKYQQIFAQNFTIESMDQAIEKLRTANEIYSSENFCQTSNR